MITPSLFQKYSNPPAAAETAAGEKDLLTAHFDAVLIGISGRICVDQRLDHIHVRGREIRDQRPSACGRIPLGHADQARTTMVFARHVERRTKARQAKARHLLFGDLQRFHTVTHHARGDVGHAVDALRRLGSLSGQHRGIKTTVIKNRTDLIARTSGQPFVDHMLLNIGKHGEVAAHTMEGQRLVAVRRVTRRQHVVFRTGPPDTDEIFHRIADVGGFLHGNLVHNAPAIHDDIVRTLATNLQPLRFLLLTGMVHSNQAQFKTMLCRQLF
mmetsp:Transcript_23540/g.41604  ORF Transcript_23540/g.41604 Transcript_23540/m.41604 type:complete len:271 (-) Transcript_23540:1819-2631(-)